jgi:carbonic anhydrase/acetyltransferase-like protein (isoleucine patch superfamily)
MIYQLGEDKVTLHETAYVAPSAQVMGKVTLKEGASVWFNAVIRGDCDPIVVGENSNVQDCSVLHTDIGFPMNIGKGVTIGHKVMLHGCDIGDFSLIGINAVVLNGAKIGKHCVIGANALITENMIVPDRSVVMGSPGKIVKQVSDKQAEMLETAPLHYTENAAYFKQNLVVQQEN